MAITDNVLASWKYDESSGNAADASGNGVTLTNTNATYGAGKINNAVSVSAGSSARLQSAAAVIGTNTAFTIATWFNSSTKSGNGAIYSQYTSVVAGVWWFNISASGYMNYSQFNGSSVFGATDNVDICDGNWHLIVMTINSAHNSVQYSTDNSSFRTVAITGVATLSTHVGSVGWKNNDYYTGSFDSMTLWSREITIGEVGTLWNGGAGVQYPFAASSSVKTVDGLANASVKTVDGLAIASVKTINGLA